MTAEFIIIIFDPKRRTNFVIYITLNTISSTHTHTQNSVFPKVLKMPGTALVQVLGVLEGRLERHLSSFPRTEMHFDSVGSRAQLTYHPGLPL